MEIANDAVRIFTLPTGKIMAHFIVYAEGHGYYISEYIGFCGFARFRGLKRSFDRLSAIDPFLVAKILNAIAVFTEHFFTAKQCHRGVTGHFHFAAAVLVLPIFFSRRSRQCTILTFGLFHVYCYFAVLWLLRCGPGTLSIGVSVLCFAQIFRKRYAPMSFLFLRLNYRSLWKPTQCCSTFCQR